MQSSYYRRSIAVGVLIGVIAGLSFASGYLMRGIGPNIVSATQTQAHGDYCALQLEVQSLLEGRYLRGLPDIKTQEYAAIRGLLSSLNDRYTFFIDPPVAQSESDALAGTYGGIGISVQRAESGELLLFPFDGGPAERAGIVGGDILLSVNGASVDYTTQADVLDQMLRGEVKEGNGVTIVVRSGADGSERSLFVPFGVINVPSVMWRMVSDEPAIGYIQIMLFTSRTPDEINSALESLSQKNAAALILDLRNNSGGLLQEAIDVAGNFLPEGTIVIERTREGETPVSPTATTQLTTDLPVAVLVNAGTASAAELIAGAISDRGRGVLIGQQTYGKGTIQQIYRLSDSSSLHITTAEWLTPNGFQLEGNGLTPSIVMIPDVNGRDVELGEAKRYLTDLLAE